MSASSILVNLLCARPRPYAQIACIAILSTTSLCFEGQTSAPHQESKAALSALPMRNVNALEAPLSFEPNVGQFDGAAPFPARYIAHGRGFLLRLEPSRAVIDLDATESHASASTVAFDFVGSSPDAAAVAVEPLGARHSYFPSSDVKSWKRSVPTYARVNYQGLYPGVDMSFYGQSGRLEYDFVVKPGSDPHSIVLALEGADQVHVEDDGSLSLGTHGSEIKLLKPIAYQQASEDTARKLVAAGYVLQPADALHHAPSRLTFQLGEYDHSKPLIIDPVLIAGTGIPALAGYNYPPYYYGNTVVNGMTVDAAGNIYVATASTTYNSPYSVLKFSPSGELLLNVSLGSASVAALPQSIAVSEAGDIYLVGSSAAGLPTTPGAFQPLSLSSSSYTQTAFLTVIKADGSALLYSTYLGGSSGSSITSVALDGNGKVYVTGSADGGDFPTTSGSYQPSLSNTEGAAEFVAKLDPSKSGSASLVYSTYLISTQNYSGNYSFGTSIAVDKAGSAYVGGAGTSGFPATAGAYAFNGVASFGGYVTKLSPDGSALAYSAYLGPGVPNAIAVDGSGAAYVAGAVSSAEFPTSPGAYQTAYPGGFAAKLTPDGSSLAYSTFLSGPSGYNSNSFTPSKIALYPGCLSACNALVAGMTTAADLPLMNAVQSFASSSPQLAPNEQYATGFLVGLSGDGESALLSTYLGAAASPTYSVGGIAFDSSANIYYAANDQGSDAPLTAPLPQNAGEGFILKISLANAGRALAIPSQFMVATPQAVRSTSVAAGTVQLRNMGSQAITLTRPLSFSSAEFSETDKCGSSLAGGAICMLNISFTPAASGTRSAELSIASSGVNSPTVVSLSGTGLDAPNLLVSASSLEFADQIVGSASAAQTVTLSNTGDQPQPLLALTSSLPDYIPSSTCSAQLAPQASCRISIKFSPTQIGLRSGQAFVQLPGYSDGYSNGITISLAGSGVLSSTGTGSLTFSTNGLNFGSVVVGNGTGSQTATLINTGDVPVTINSVAVTTKQGAAGDFSLNTASLYSNYFCGGSGYSASTLTFPYELPAQSSCSIEVNFQPSGAEQETGSLEVLSSASGGSQVASLSGVGLHSVQALTVEPGKLVFPPQPVGDPSAIQTFTITNNANNVVVLDRAVTSGDFAIVETESFSCEGATLGPLASCTLSILFNPTAVGARSGTLTLVDTVTGNPQVFNLTGTAIQATGALVLGQTSLKFPAQPMGTTSSEQEIIVSNPGNSAVTINNLVATGDFAVVMSYDQTCGGALAPASTCQIEVVFSPTKSSGTETGVLTLHSTTGNITVNLSGTAVAAAQAIHLTASSVSLGSAQVGAPAGSVNYAATIYIENTGNEPVTFSAPPTFSAPSSNPASDFALVDNDCYAYLPQYPNETGSPLQPGQSCAVTISFTPSLQATETATMTLVGSAGTETLALTGKGVAKAPAVTIQPATLSLDQSIVGLPSSPYNYNYQIAFANNGTQPVTLSSITVTAGSSDFSLSTIFGSCAGQTIYPGNSCYSYFLFQPSVRGYRTGKVTFVDGNGNSYIAALAGYGLAEVNAVSVTPQSAVLPPVALQGNANPYDTDSTNVTLTNNGNAPVVVGTLTGTNIASGDDFTITYPGGYDSCGGSTIQAGQSCQTTVGFTPQKIGKRTGSLQYPVTYADNTTGSVTATLSGVGLSNLNSGNLLPQSAVFPVQVAGVTNQSYQNQVQFVLTNSGTVPMTVGNLAGTDLASSSGTQSDFLVTYDGCSTSTLSPGGTCNFDIFFTPVSVGQKAGTVTVPVTYAGGATVSFTSTLSGNGTAPAPALLVSPTSLAFNVEVAGTTDTTNVESTLLSSVGNAAVTLTSVSASKNFTVQPNSCYGSFSAPFSCYIAVAFTPSASTPPGVVNGTLTIVDNAPGSPHLVKLSGTVISTAAQLALSQTSVTFGNQPVSTSSAPQVVYLTDLGSSGSLVQINSIQLGGTNPGDFTETENCGGTLGFSIGGRQGCMIFVASAPAAGSLGTRTANVTVTPAQGPPLIIQLIGQGVSGSSPK